MFLGAKTLAEVAQLVEQLICNQQVGGSSPFASSAGPACQRARSFQDGQVAEWLKATDCKSVLSRVRRFEPCSAHGSLSYFKC